MKPKTTLWRITAAATAVSMTLGVFTPTIAAPPPIVATTTPPGRVGRLAYISGTVSFHTADQMTWSPAILNYPITTGNALWTEPSAEALIEVSGNRLAMDGATEFDITTLDDHVLAGNTPQGELYLNLRSVPNGDTYTIQTPRGAVQIAAVGRYEVVAGDTDHPTTITVVEGAAQITGTNIALQVGAGQMASINGTNNFQGVVGPINQDAFLTKMLARERPTPRSAVPVPAVVAAMTGCEDLDQYGTWSETPQNGVVWYPRVETGWVPYRHGRWSYVAPWGWTWVDDAPWGFAPFHYGRWIESGDRWGWIPADPGVQAYPQPVYAPALVNWIDIGGAAAVGAAAGALLAGGRDRSVGWVPLGPNEPYYPPYSHSLNYIRAMNVTNVRNVTQVINPVNIQGGRTGRQAAESFVNRAAATVVPAETIIRSAPVATGARTLSPQQFAQARTQFQPPIAPTAATIGITPAVARQFNLTPAARPGAAGPAINPAALRATQPQRAPGESLPSLRPGVGAAQRPGDAARPAAAPGPAAEPARPIVTGPPRPGALPELRPTTPGHTPNIVTPDETIRPAAPQAAAPRAAEPAHPPAEAERREPAAAPRPAPVAAPPRTFEARPTPAVQPRPVAPRPVQPRTFEAPPRQAPPVRAAPARPAEPAPRRGPPEEHR